MSQTITKEQMDSITFDDVLKLRTIRQLRDQISEELTLKQFKPCMFKNHLEFAQQVLKVSKSLKLQTKANRIIELWTELRGEK